MKKINYTKSKLITNTIKEIQKNGFQNIEISEIVRLSSVSETEMDQCFEGEEELLDSTLLLISKHFDIYIETCWQLIDAQNSFQCMTFLGEAMITWIIKEPRLAEFLISQKNSNQELKCFSLNASSDLHCMLRTHNILTTFITDFHLDIDADELFSEYWSFFQGYAQMIKNEELAYERVVLENMLRNFIENKAFSNQQEGSST